MSVACAQNLSKFANQEEGTFPGIFNKVLVLFFNFSIVVTFVRGILCNLSLWRLG